MPEKINVGAVLLADYVAQGHANKITIVNAYSGEILLERLPADVGFGIYIELNFGTGGPPEGLTFEALLDGQQVVHGRATQSTGSGDTVTVAVPHVPFHIERNCDLELYVSAEGYERTLVLRKSLREGVISSG